MKRTGIEKDNHTAKRLFAKIPAHKSTFHSQTKSDTGWMNGTSNHLTSTAHPTGNPAPYQDSR